MSQTKRTPQQKPMSDIQDIISEGQVDISFDLNAFQAFIQSQGIKIAHLRAVPDPSGMIDRGDTHANLYTRGSSDSFKYIKAGCLYALFSSNGTQTSQINMGELSPSTAYMTTQSQYIGTAEPVLLSPHDRFYLEDVEVRVVARQFVEANASGVDRLQFPAICVEVLIDARGKEYKENVDFEITDEGHIKWTGQNRPGFETQTQKGTVYSIRYRYTPFFVVNQLMHEIRVAQVTDPTTFERYLERLPYQAQVLRENVFLDRNAAVVQKTQEQTDRYQYAPPVGGKFGPK